MGLPANFGCVPAPVSWRGQAGKGVALSGSCSVATRKQVAYHAQSNPTREIDARQVIEEQLTPDQIADWLLDAGGLPLAYSTADPAEVADVQNHYGRAASASALEHFFAEVARRVIAGGVTRLITAGGETSGAIVEGLDLSALEIGPEIDPGVPALRARPDLVVALKSGNFGAEDFFAKADRLLAGAP
jgi:uncharacterized protein YgbK (DUF1537 family)